jgi:hypothetical protein
MGWPDLAYVSRSAKKTYGLASAKLENANACEKT